MPYVLSAFPSPAKVGDQALRIGRTDSYTDYSILEDTGKSKEISSIRCQKNPLVFMQNRGLVWFAISHPLIKRALFSCFLTLFPFSVIVKY